MVTNEQDALNRLISDRCLRSAAQAILQQLHAADGTLSTRMQQFMPLLEKFKECDIEMDEHENLNPKQLCPQIAETLQEGLSVPESQKMYCGNLKEMIQFIQAGTELETAQKVAIRATSAVKRVCEPLHTVGPHQRA